MGIGGLDKVWPLLSVSVQMCDISVTIILLCIRLCRISVIEECLLSCVYIF